MHPNNRHSGRYDLQVLKLKVPALEKYIVLKHEQESIDFSSPEAVKLLNEALLLQTYNLSFWDLPAGSLCPPVPGRADYIHYLAELPGIPKQNVRALDIGTGAGLIYPLIGFKEYGWKFVATDIDASSLKFAQTIIQKNGLETSIELRLQENKENILKGIIKADDRFHLSMCNPPFYESAEEALAENSRKTKNLKLQSVERNFGGSTNELWTPGGEKNFVRKMIFESSELKNNVLWFTSLVSKSEHLQEFERIAKKQGAISRIYPMEQGQKRSRFFAWSFQ
jgi:23S rRNA (adenine1618-N6)-methyltransferase